VINMRKILNKDLRRKRHRNQFQ